MAGKDVARGSRMYSPIRRTPRNIMQLGTRYFISWDPQPMEKLARAVLFFYFKHVYILLLGLLASRQLHPILNNRSKGGFWPGLIPDNERESHGQRGRHEDIDW